MSTATAFATLSPFPFCVADISGTLSSTNYSHVDNLTLADVMAFFWNLETFTITTAGSATKSGGGGGTVSADCSITLNPIGSTVRAYARAIDIGDFFTASAPTSPTAFASWPAIRQPNERVCHTAGAVVAAGTLMDIQWSDSAAVLTSNTSTVKFYVGTDPINADRYRLYYRIAANFQGGSGGDLRAMHFDNDSTVFGGVITSITSGTITIGALTLNWYSGYVGTSFTGGTMTATSTSFTY